MLCVAQTTRMFEVPGGDRYSRVMSHGTDLATFILEFDCLRTEVGITPEAAWKATACSMLHVHVFALAIVWR